MAASPTADCARREVKTSTRPHSHDGSGNRCAIAQPNKSEPRICARLAPSGALDWARAYRSADGNATLPVRRRRRSAGDRHAVRARLRGFAKPPAIGHLTAVGARGHSRTMSRPRTNLPSYGDVKPSDPLRLDVAAALAYPDGSMTASGLRREAARGRLVIERTAGKDYTTLAEIERMRELCRAGGEGRVSGSSQPVATETATSTLAAGRSATDPSSAALASARARTKALSKMPSPLHPRQAEDPARSGPSSR
jgi:hypothetical protein